MREKTLRTSLVSLPLALSFGLLAACTEDSSSPQVDAGPDPVATADAATDAAVQLDAESMAADATTLLDAAQVEADGALQGDAETDAGPPALGPYQLDCAHLPSNGTCQGGPREVLLVTEDHGLIAMFDPGDGHFLGYLKRPAASYYASNVADYVQATQGPDQCIWTVSEHDDAQVQRWNTDGSYRDAPLTAHSFPSSSPAGDPAVQDPIAIAFNGDRLFVASQSGDPYPRLTRWKLDGSFDGVVLDDGSEARSVLPLNDGSLLISDSNKQRVARLKEGSQQAELVLGGLEVPGQLWYAGNDKLLVSDSSSGTPLHQVDLTTGLASTVVPDIDHITNKYGVAALKNGKWLIAGGDFLVSSVDPASSNPVGKLEALWDDPAVDSVTFHNIGRACLPNELVAARAPKPPQDTCIAPPAGVVIFEETFEGSGNFEGTGTARHYKSFYDRGAAGVTSSIDATGGNQGSRGLRIAGAGTVSMPGGRTRTHKTGVFSALPTAKPTYVRYRVKAGSDYDYWLGYVALQNAAANADQYDRLAGTYFYKGYLNSLTANTSSYPEALDARWLLVELRNIDWSSRTYDLYVDCKRMAEAIALPAGLGDSLDLLDLYNVDSTVTAETVTWYDDILIK